MGEGNHLLSIITGAGLAGLIILNYKGANTLLGTLAGGADKYVSTVQGR